MIKRQLIMEKALELFAEQGFEATSVQKITDHCGISKGAFYLSFKSKDELILALIDHFMMQIIADIDYVVMRADDESQLLYKFYYITFQSFQKHSDFAKILMKEQSHSFNKELILKTRYYDRLSEEIILSMIERLYGKEVQHIKYDLIFTIKSFMRMYSELFLFYNETLDLDLMSQSLVEKTNLLARNTTVPFISQELIQMVTHPMNEEVTKEKILEFLDQKIVGIEESIEKESLLLLKQELLEPKLSLPLVKGLLENIRNHPHCKWISYLLRGYYKL